MSFLIDGIKEWGEQYIIIFNLNPFLVNELIDLLDFVSSILNENEKAWEQAIEE